MSASGANTAERGPTHTRASPERSRSHSSWRSPWPSPEWSTATTSPNRAWNRPTVCGVSAISGTSTIAPRPAASVSCTARRYTSVLPDPVTPWSRNRLAGARSQRAEHLVERGLLLAGQRRRTGRAGGRSPPTPGGALGARWPIATSPRPSSRRSVGVPSAAATVGPSRPSASSVARWRSLSAPSPPSASRARVGELGHQRALARPRRRFPAAARASAPAPASSSTRSAIQPASATRSGGTPGGEDRVGLGQPLGRELGLVGELEHDPERPAPAERDPQQRADADVGLVGAQPVVERPADRARQRERLDAGDRCGLAEGRASVQRRVKSGEDDGR